LSRPRRREKFHSVFLDGDLARDVTVQQLRSAWKSFLAPKRDIVAPENALRSGHGDEGGDDLRPERFQSRAHQLHDEPSVVPIANERGAAVALTVNEPEGIRLGRELSAPGHRCGDAAPPPVPVDRRVRIAVDHAQRDLRLRAPERPTDLLAALVFDDHRARDRAGTTKDVAAVNPGMASSPAAGALGVYSGDVSHAPNVTVPRTVLALHRMVSRIWTFGVGIATGALVLRERRGRIWAERLGSATLETLHDAIDANDAETGAHVRRVATYADILSCAAGLDEHTVLSIERVALFHDIGKLHEALSDILHDKSELSPEEWRAIRTHPERGKKVLAPLAAFYPELGKGVVAHHERWDGGGYPRGTKGKRIPIAARVVAIADTFDAITHRRAYSAARSLKTAAAAIAAGRGTQFDPELVDLFLSPPVIADVAAAMKHAHSPRARSGARRGGRQHPATDLKFRWRTRARKRRAPDR